MAKYQQTPPPTGLCPCPDWLGEKRRGITHVLRLLEDSLSGTYYGGPICMRLYMNKSVNFHLVENTAPRNIFILLLMYSFLFLEHT